MIIQITTSIDIDYEEQLYKTTIIKGEFPGRGELFPYY